jgi:DNA-binding LytR/AlgR family response regulator
MEIRRAKLVCTLGPACDSDEGLRSLLRAGMDVARLDQELPAIVFVTAHEHYAVEAFNVQAVDYLLKPVRPERLLAAVERVRARKAGKAPATAQPDARAVPPRVTSTSRGLIQLFDAREITRFWASDKYTLFRAGGEERLTEEPLAALEERLEPFGFLRVHRAELVRTDAVRALRLVDGHYELSLSDGQRARVSRRALPAIKLALGLV